MQKVYVVGARRTAIGSFGGSLKDTPATELASIAIRAALADAGVDPDAVEETILGNVLTAGAGMGPGRQASIGAGIPERTPGYTVNMLCGSGLKAVMLAADAIILGRAGVVVAAGAENMSRAPYLLPHVARWGGKLGNLELIDHLIHDGLHDVFNDYHMGVTAENVARRHGITREAQDEFAVSSQRKTAEAMQSGAFEAEIVAVEVRRKREAVSFETDEYPRADTTVEALSGLRPAFEKDGTVTAGNASGINDGASAIVLAGEEAVESLGLRPLAEVVTYAQAGIDPAHMGLGPVPAIDGVLKAADIPLSAVDVIELNEAFAAQSIGVLTELADSQDLDYGQILERTNLNGGAIALGHPIGASGNRIAVTLIHAMKARGLETGLASLCVGGGMGLACLFRIHDS